MCSRAALGCTAVLRRGRITERRRSSGPLQMKGDYHRYLAEFKTSSDRKDAAEHTLLAYKAAQVRTAAPQFE